MGRPTMTGLLVDENRLEASRKSQEHRYRMQMTREVRHRRQLIEKLGKKCTRCGFSDIRALQIDVIDGSGHRGVPHFYTYHYRHMEEALKVLQVLCANCNWIKRVENGEGLQLKYRRKV